MIEAIVIYGPAYLNGESTNLEDLGLWPPACGILMALVAEPGMTITDALPDENTFPDLSVFTEARYFAVESASTPAFKISGEITSITVIPEPASVLLFALGGLALRRSRRK